MADSSEVTTGNEEVITADGGAEAEQSDAPSAADRAAVVSSPVLRTPSLAEEGEKIELRPSASSPLPPDDSAPSEKGKSMDLAVD